MTTTQTDPFTVTRTDTGVVIANAIPDLGAGRDDNPRRFTLTLTTRHQVDRFLDHLYHPTCDLTTDDWLGIMTVDDTPPVEPRVTTVLRLVWPDDSPTPEAHLTVLLWPDYTHPHVYLDLNLAAVGRLYGAVAQLVDSALPTRDLNPNRTDRDTADPHRSHDTYGWAICTSTCAADRTETAEPRF